MKKLFLLFSITFISFANLSCNQTTTENFTNETTNIPETTIEVGTEFTLFEMAKFHSMAVTTENKVYIWGSNAEGQLGDEMNLVSEINDISNYFDLSANEDIIDIALGEFHSSLLTSDNRLFIWGYNRYGQFGDLTTDNSNVPVEVSQYHDLNENEKIIEIESGAGNMMSLTSKGRVFSWGYNEYGQVGIGFVSAPQTRPIDITPSFHLKSDESVIKISIGYHHSAVLTSSGRILIWGYNKFGQLGNGTVTDFYYPTDHTEYVSLGDGETIVDIEMGYYHSALITSENRVFVWGLNGSGQVGNGTNENILLPNDITTEFALEEDDFITNLTLGGWSSSALSYNGEVFTWGCNGQGRLALSAQRDFLNPTNVLDQFDLYPDEMISYLVLDAWSSSAVTTYGRLFTWGRNNTFQLGHSFHQERNPIPKEVIIK